MNATSSSVSHLILVKDYKTNFQNGYACDRDEEKPQRLNDWVRANKVGAKYWRYDINNKITTTNAIIHSLETGSFVNFSIAWRKEVNTHFIFILFFYNSLFFIVILIIVLKFKIKNRFIVVTIIVFFQNPIEDN